LWGAALWIRSSGSRNLDMRISLYRLDCSLFHPNCRSPRSKTIHYSYGSGSYFYERLLQGSIVCSHDLDTFHINSEDSVLHSPAEMQKVSCESIEPSFQECRPPSYNPQSCNLAVYLPRSMTNSSTTWTNEVYRSSYVHGRFAISRFEECGYALAILPLDTVVESQIEFTSPHGTSQVTTSSSYSIAKSLLAIFQFSYAVFTLIRSTQGEIGSYGTPRAPCRFYHTRSCL
jgi:hypothetical protein